MNPRDAQSTPNQEQARKQREEAAHRQQIQLRQQALKIAKQRELAAKQKEAASTGRPAEPKPLSARSVYTPPPPKKTTVKTAAPKVAVPTAAAPARPAVQAVVVSPKKSKPVAAVPKLDPEEMRAEMREFAHENDPPVPPAEPVAPAAKKSVPVKTRKTVKVEEPPPLPALDEIEIETVPASSEAEMPVLKLAVRQPGGTDGPMVVDIPEDVLPPALNPLTRDHTVKLKMDKSSDMSCPKCGWLIPAAQRGTYYTECRRCGEITKMDAA